MAKQLAPSGNFVISQALKGARSASVRVTRERWRHPGVDPFGYHRSETENDKARRGFGKAITSSSGTTQLACAPWNDSCRIRPAFRLAIELKQILMVAQSLGSIRLRHATLQNTLQFEASENRGVQGGFGLDFAYASRPAGTPALSPPAWVGVPK